MSLNSFGNLLRLTTYGESHGQSIGGVLDGMPAGVELDHDAIQYQLQRRRPGQSAITSPRQESDEFQLLSGLFEGITTGHPIGFQIINNDKKSDDYAHIQNTYRPSHADYTYQQKYGIRDYRGGGRASARETASWVLAGSIAKHIIPDISIYSFVSQIADIRYDWSYEEIDLRNIDSNHVRCPDMEVADQMTTHIEEIKSQGDSLGGIITTIVQNVPIGLGEPIFHKLEAELAKAMMSIPAVKGFEIGSGFEGTRLRGSQHNDVFLSSGKTKTNHSGGIQGGISNGMNIVFRTAFKPTSTIMQSQSSIDQQGNEIALQPKGRHDPCVLPRAVPIVDALTALVLADMTLIQRTRKF